MIKDTPATTKILFLLISTLSFAAEFDWYEGTMDSDNGATRDYYNREARLEWRNFMGDWSDSNNVEQGSRAYGSIELTNFGSGQWIEIEVTSLVNEWLDGTWPNKGMLLRLATGSTTHKFRSREASAQNERPQLVVSTTNGNQTLIPTADTYLEESTYQGFGDSEELRISSGSAILIRFDLNDIGSTNIISAILRLYDFQQYSGTARLGVYRCTQGHEQPDSSPQMGLAARFPNDSGIQNHADVYFFTGFESANWKDEWTEVSRSANYVQLDSDASNNFEPLQGKAVRARIVKDGNYGGSIIYKFQEQTGSEPEEIYWRYYLRFGDNWNPTIDGGKLPGISGTYGMQGWGGRPVHGDDGWSARGHFGKQLSPDNPLGAKNPIGYYCYHLDMVGDYGHSWRWPIGYRGYLENNRWYCVEQYVKMNNPSSHDGILRGWVDGYLAFEKTDLSFRTVDFLKVEQIWMNLYHGGKDSSIIDMDQYYDNIVIAKQYIGPMAHTSNTNGKRYLNSHNRTPIITIVHNGLMHIQMNDDDDDIRGIGPGLVRVNIFDSAGRTVFTAQYDNSRKNIDLYNGSLPPSIYICDITVNNIHYSKSFITIQNREIQ